MNLKPDDAVLVIGLRDRTKLREWAAAVHEGSLVGIGTDEEVRAARRELVDLDNVMFTTGSRLAIPWRAAFFSKLIDSEGGDVSPEMERVLALDGAILRA